MVCARLYRSEQFYTRVSEMVGGDAKRMAQAVSSSSAGARRTRIADRKTIAHGLLSLSLIPTFVREIIGLKVVKNTLNYGANRVRYLTPVPATCEMRLPSRAIGPCGGLQRGVDGAHVGVGCL
jgi:MaoC like domain